MLPLEVHFIGKMILRTQAHRVVLKAVCPALHSDQPLAATNAIYGLLVALLQDAAPDHGGNLREHTAVSALDKVAAKPFRRSASCRIQRLRPGTIHLPAVLAACHVDPVLIYFLRGTGPGFNHVPLVMKDVTIAVDLPKHVISLSGGSGCRSYPEGADLLHRIQSFLEFFFPAACADITGSPGHNGHPNGQANDHPNPIAFPHE